MSEANRERRRAPRVTASGDAQLLGRSSPNVRVLDVSLRGCLLRCEQRVALGQILDVVLALEGGDVHAKARVAEVSLDGAGSAAPGYLAGMEFLGLAAEDEQRLERFVQAARRRKAAPAF
jgi:c-di-GMP-binding flagellar brake protein YcgR